MTLPAGTWDLGYFDSDVDTDFVGLRTWTSTSPPVGSIVSAGIFGFDTAGATVNLDGDMVTAAMSVRVDGPVDNPNSAIVLYVDHYLAYVGLSGNGIYLTFDGGTFVHSVTQDLVSAFHEIYCIWDSVAVTITVNVDGTDVCVLTPGTGLIDLGGPVANYQFVAGGGAYATEIKYMAVSTTAQTPGGGGGPVSTSFHVGATGVTFKIDEYANYPDGLTDAQILIHYKAGKGIAI